jgi:hypothetical protein
MRPRVVFVSGLCFCIALVHIICGPSNRLMISRFSIATTLPTTPDTSFCTNNSKTEFCCSKEHCSLVKRSTLYSQCCGNIATTPPPRPIVKGKSYSYMSPLRRKHMTMVHPILVTATPRSGTVFLQTLLSKLGIVAINDMQSPRRSVHVMVSWMHIFQDNVYFGPTDLFGSKFMHVWHQVRDPLKSLTSIAFTEPIRTNKAYLDFLGRHITLTDATEVEAMVKQRSTTGRIISNATTLEKQLEEHFLIFRGMEMYLQWQQYLLDLTLPGFSLEDLTVHHNFTVIHQIFRISKRTPPSDANLISIIQRTRRKRRRLLIQRTISTNSRTHRHTLDWEELCQVHVDMTQQFLRLSHTLGYYLDKGTVCQ